MPSSGLNFTGRVPRSHHLALSEADAARGFPIYSMIGGKLTTFRAFAEEVTDKLKKVNWPSRKETYYATIVVIVMVVISTLVLSTFDVIWSFLAGKILK